MDAVEITNPVLELSLAHAREQRGEMALWLAAQVLMSDDVALADEALQERLLVLQDRIENMMRVRLGLRDRDARDIRLGPGDPDEGERSEASGAQ